MTSISSKTHAHVIQTYQKGHSFKCPPYPLQQCGFSRAFIDLRTVFIFANPPLQPGDQVPIDQLQVLAITAPDPHYYLSGQTAAISQTADAQTSPAGKKKTGYTPDTFKSPDEIWRITRSLC